MSMYTFNADSEDHHYFSSTKRRKLCDFESHMTGNGLRLMEKMGYKGGGLGKNEQGILNPIEVKLRPQFSGLGFNKSKETPTLQTEKKSEPGGGVQPIVGRKRERAWLNQKKKEEEVYVTAEDFLASKQEQVFQKIYDMRGPQVRVYTNLCYLNAEEKAKEKDVPMAELQYFVGLIVPLAEVDIQKIDRNLRNEKDIAFSLKNEKEKLEDEAAFQKKQLDNYENIKSVLDRVEEEKTLGTLTLDSLAQCFRDIHKRYTEDYKLWNFSYIACSYALPLFIRVFKGWDPLQSPSHGLELVSQWKTLLQEDDCFDIWDINISSPYADFVFEVVLPAVRIPCINTWDARVPELMLRFLESWEKLLPSSVIADILDKIVLPKLSSAADTWEPHRETIPIHTWVHPWLPLLGNKLDGIHQTIHLKFSTFLSQWHPSNDGSVYALLSPWKTVFDADSWQQLMHRFIVPKLKAILKDDKFQVNPASQNLDQFYCVMNWASAIPIHLMVDTLEIFFDKWLKVLYHWLCSNPNFNEVTKWYLGWKELIPKELLANKSIQYKLKCGLDMMNQAVEGMEVVQPVLKEKIAAASFQQQAAASLVDAIKVDGANEMSMKELIEAYAQDNGLLFKLKPGRKHNGHQIYGFGNVSIVIDSWNQKVYAQNDETWSLGTLERLLELQKRR
ncbi:hypothetical protein TSUD_177830 [Trifolium subterraneum]|uniref:G-patch domain-containing protein n=1 Tax=Trifolium subterraneum TaxID=3900 RepID=A0A2Z6LIS3_TRISU|nr:hypothetical protein TSUD_177830 [Trifolium subterraneum]